MDGKYDQTNVVSVHVACVWVSVSVYMCGWVCVYGRVGVCACVYVRACMYVCARVYVGVGVGVGAASIVRIP